MPSGFQQDTNQLNPNFYRVTVDLSGYNSTATSTQSGSVEPDSGDAFATQNTTLDNSKRRARGQLRWEAIIQQLQSAGDVKILDVTALEAGPSTLDVADDVTTSLSFTVMYERDAFVLLSVRDRLLAEGRVSSSVAKLSDHETLATATSLTTTAQAIQELVVRGITKGYRDYVTNVSTAVSDTLDVFTKQARTFDGTSGGQGPITVAAPVTPKVAHTDVTVSLVDTVTLVTA